MTATNIRNNMTIVNLDNGSHILVSYSTNVAVVTAGGQFVKLWDGYSATTMRHINDFRALYGFDKMNKAKWIGLPIQNI